jgi:hypothetical protein
LQKLADNKGAARGITEAVALHFDKLLDNVRNELALKVADVSNEVIRALGSSFDKLPENIRNEIFRKLKKE